MELQDMKLGDVMKIVGCLGTNTCQSSILVVGQNYMVQTVTKYFTGRLVAFDNSEIVLEDVWDKHTTKHLSVMENFMPIVLRFIRETRDSKLKTMCGKE